MSEAVHRYTYVRAGDSNWSQVRYRTRSLNGVDHAIAEDCIVLGPVSEQVQLVDLLEHKFPGLVQPMLGSGNDRFLVIPHSPNLHLEIRGAGIKSGWSLWPAATIPFELDGALPFANSVRAAMNTWSAACGVKFVKRTGEVDYVNFQLADECQSTVGKVGGVQTIFLSEDCKVGHVLHEVGHCLGLWHEHCRGDRDDYLIVHWTNVNEVDRSLLNPVASKRIGPYDYGSIMHYPGNAYARERDLVTLEPRFPLPAGVVLGQRDALSAGDIDAVRLMYGLV